MSRIFTEVEALAAALSELAQPCVVGIDGWTGIGKTTLATRLASNLSTEYFDIDAALNRDRNSYVPALRIHEVSAALSDVSGLMLVSGICLRKVLEIAGREADSNIYVKRMTSWGWADEDELQGRELAEILGNYGGEAVRREMRDYHAVWEPHLKADFEFHWQDC